MHTKSPHGFPSKVPFNEHFIADSNALCEQSKLLFLFCAYHKAIKNYFLMLDDDDVGL